MPGRSRFTPIRQPRRPICIGGAAFVTHSINYNNWLPTLTARYRVKSSGRCTRQFAEGSVIPPSSVFDVPGGNVLTPPKPTLAKTYQTGTVLKFNRWTLDVDAYYVHFQNGYDSYIDPVTPNRSSSPPDPPIPRASKRRAILSSVGDSQLVPQRHRGLGEISGPAPTYPNGGLWVANTPKNVESLALLWQHKNWDVGLIDKRVGTAVQRQRQSELPDQRSQ